MIVLIIFAFLAGIVTVLSPCILPLLPIILSSTADTSGKRRPFGVVVGFVGSFTFFTLFLSTLVKFSGIGADTFRFISIIILATFGASLLIPKVQLVIEQLFSKLAGYAPKAQGRTGFLGGLVIGFSLGLLWTPCVGPILASVISLAITGSVSAEAAIITLAYSIGTAIPMFMIMSAGSTALQKVPWLVRNTGKIQKAFGVLMILTAVGIYFNVDRRFQTYILDLFPGYGTGLTQLEDNELVRNQLEGNMGSQKDHMSLLAPKGVLAPEIIPGGAWLNSEPLRLESLRGKVVIVDFWTYSCINCQRTLPYLNNWWEKYKDDGLVIIGVHSPEFEFEKDLDNLKQAIDDFNVEYPVVQDNNFTTWRAYSNRYWPAKYIIDKEGFIRYTHFGEGAYDETEEAIRELLKETGVESFPQNIDNPDYTTYSRTPESYLGYARLKNFSSNEEIVKDNIQRYSSPESIPENTIAFDGDFKVTREYTNPGKGAKLHLNFESKEVFLVMNPKNGEGKVKVLVDGEEKYFGASVENGIVAISSDTLYKLVNLDEPGRHILTLEFLDENVEIYAFTFG